MLTVKQILISWLILVVLTIVSVLLGSIVALKSLLIFTVLAIVFVKGWQITDVFMELKSAPNMWRYLLLGYMLVIPAVVFLIYMV